ncbi:MAG: cyclase family protein [Bacteroidota bacterium]
MQATYIDLSHTIYDGLKTYQGMPASRICDFLSREASRALYEDGTEFHIAHYDFVANSGTYIDCPFHRYEGGKDLSQTQLGRFVDQPGIVVKAIGVKEIGPDFFQKVDVKDKAVLVRTDWDQHWEQEIYHQEHPYLNEEAALFLKAAGAKIVGIDSYNIDNTRGKTRPVHSILLAQEILIVDHLCNLSSLPETDFLFNAIPPKIKGAGTFPVRAYAKIFK